MLLFRRTYRFAVVLAALLSVACVTEEEPTSDETTLVRVGDVAPDFTVEMLDGGETTLSDLRGRVVMLTFWSRECPMCRAELAEVGEQVIEPLAGEEFAYLPISRDGSREEVVQFCKEQGHTFPVGIDSDRAIYNLYATMYVPRTFLIDRGGRIRLIATEYETGSLPTIVAQARELLEE